MHPGKYYHVYTHANGKENLFNSPDNYRYFLERYFHYCDGVCWTYAYCLMPNHIHFLIRIKTEIELVDFFATKYSEKTHSWKDNSTLEKYISQQFSHLLNGYTQAFNKMYKRKGSLFTHSFRRKEITDDAYLTTAIAYIHANPVRHGFVNDFTDWEWSSFNAMLSDKATTLRREDVLTWFGNHPTFVQFHSGYLTNDAAADERLV